MAQVNNRCGAEGAEVCARGVGYSGTVRAAAVKIAVAHAPDDARQALRAPAAMHRIDRSKGDCD